MQKQLFLVSLSRVQNAHTHNSTLKSVVSFGSMQTHSAAAFVLVNKSTSHSFIILKFNTGTELRCITNTFGTEGTE